jgi:outer membrane scaffolding protein for murein synthesis (MipA/OmpV family)
MPTFRSMGRGKIAMIGCAAFVLAPLSSHAEGWVVTVGGRVGVGPPYEGANHEVIVPSATFNLRRPDTPYRFTPPDGGSTVALFSNRYIDVGPMVRFRLARSDTGKLAGFDKIRWAAEPGVFVDLWPTDWLRGRIEARRGVIGHQGWTGDAGFDLIHTGHRWDFSIGPRIGYGDRNYMDTYFGVTPQDAARSPLIKTVYEPGAGERYAGLETAFSYHLTNRWRTNFDVGYHRLAKRAADSPVVQLAGSRDQVSASVGFSYSFRVGSAKAHE